MQRKTIQRVPRLQALQYIFEHKQDELTLDEWKAKLDEVTGGHVSPNFIRNNLAACGVPLKKAVRKRRKAASHVKRFVRKDEYRELVQLTLGLVHVLQRETGIDLSTFGVSLTKMLDTSAGNGQH